MTTVNSQEQINDPKLPLTAHLEELRKRLMIAMGGIFVVFVACWGFSQHIITVISAPVVPHVENLQFDTLTDPFFTHVKASFFTALFLTFPLTLSQIWLFVRPGMYKREKHVVWPFLLCSYPLFVGGAVFFYFFVFPIAIEFLVNFDKTLVPSLRIGDYLSFTVRVMFVFGLVFELPLISLLLTRMGVITAGWLARSRRYAIVIIFIAAAILTPPDVATQVLLAGPMIVLYEISIVVSWLARPRKKKKDEAEEQEEEEE
ncbi:MAG: twin-arginine translocase subunit TatC [SAR324 cluster bacterium]|nr:twin-arginine translocase subunit TatC [SAR324 cluster bacterium]